MGEGAQNLLQTTLILPRQGALDATLLPGHPPSRPRGGQFCASIASSGNGSGSFHLSACLPSLQEGKDEPPCPAGCRKDVLRAHPHPLRVWCLKAASTFSCTSHSLSSAHSLPSSSLSEPCWLAGGLGSGCFGIGKEAWGSQASLREALICLAW